MAPTQATLGTNDIMQVHLTAILSSLRCACLMLSPCVRAQAQSTSASRAALGAGQWALRANVYYPLDKILTAEPPFSLFFVGGRSTRDYIPYVHTSGRGYSAHLDQAKYLRQRNVHRDCHAHVTDLSCQHSFFFGVGNEVSGLLLGLLTTNNNAASFLSRLWPSQCVTVHLSICKCFDAQTGVVVQHEFHLLLYFLFMRPARCDACLHARGQRFPVLSHTAVRGVTPIIHSGDIRTRDKEDHTVMRIPTEQQERPAPRNHDRDALIGEHTGDFQRLCSVK